MTDDAYMSWGGGVQSTTLSELCIRRDPRLLEVCAEKTPLPSAFIFADTGNEPARLYPHVEACAARIREAGFAFVQCKRHQDDGADLWTHVTKRALAGQRSISNPPVYVKRVTRPGRMPAKRGCTFMFKVRPLDAAARKHLGIKRVDARWKRENKPVAHWYGISKDEVTRVRVSPDAWRWNFYPLIEMGWTRSDCIAYLGELGIKPMRSACTFCPFHSDAEWQWVKQDALDWAEVVELERSVQAGFEAHGTFAGLNSMPYLHPSGVPIDQVVFAKRDGTYDDECAGVCGV